MISGVLVRRESRAGLPEERWRWGDTESREIQGSVLRRSDTPKVSACLRAVSPYPAASLPLAGAAFAHESKP